MNVGTARYWWCYTSFKGPVVVDATLEPPPPWWEKSNTLAGPEGAFVIDRGPINQWTGKRHDGWEPPHPPLECNEGGWNFRREDFA